MPSQVGYSFSGAGGTFSPTAQPLAGLSCIGAVLLTQDTVYMVLSLLPSEAGGISLPICGTRGPGSWLCLKISCLFRPFLCCSFVLRALPHSPLDLLGLLKLSPKFLWWLFWIASPWQVGSWQAYYF